MKRILIISLALMLIVTLFCVSVSAASYKTYEATWIDLEFAFYDCPPAGLYDVTVYFYDSTLTASSVEVFDEGGYFSASLMFDNGMVAQFDFYPDGKFVNTPMVDGMTFDRLVFVSLSPSEPSPEPVDLLDSVSDGIDDVISWIKTIVHELVAADGQLHGLLPLVGIAVAITVIFVAIKIVHIFI